MKKELIITIILVLFIMGCNDSSIEQTMDEKTTLMHKDFKATMNADWQELEIDSSIFVYLPPETSEEDVNAELIYVNIVDLGDENELTLENILESGIENSELLIPDFELTENIDGGNKYLDGKRIKFKGTQDGVKRSNIQVFGIKNNILYTLTYSCPIDSCNSNAIFDTLVETFEPVN